MSETIKDLMTDLLEEEAEKPVAEAAQATEVERLAAQEQAPKKAKGKGKGKKKPAKKINPLKIIDSDKILTVGETGKVLMSEWFEISSPEFKNSAKFPPIPMPDFTTKKIKLSNGYFRVNEMYDPKKKKTGIPGKNFFWFRFSDKNLYYSYSPSSLAVLGSISIKEVADVQADDKNTHSPHCFKLVDDTNSKWTLCAKDEDTKKNWICKVKEVLGVFEEECNTVKMSDAAGTVINQKVTQPIILIPLPSKDCNEKWNYKRKGDDWNCDCSEGKEQSPVDLPIGKNAIQSPVKPLFQFEEVIAKSTQTTSDGQVKGTKYLQIEYKEGTLLIDNADFGKTVTIDGAVYKASQIKFHTPSEHTIKGKRYEMEMQVIHYGQTKGDIAKQLVLSLLFEKAPGTYNKFIDDVDFFNLPNPLATKREIINNLYIPKVFFSADSEEIPIVKPFSFYTYQGSLSAPPCTERTVVYVASKPIKLGTTALEMFKEAIKIPDMVDSNGNVVINTSESANYRKTQPLNGRHVFYYSVKKRTGPEPPERPKHVPIGHYEKVKKKMTEYFYVNTRRPSGLPGSFVVSEAEAKGLN